MGRTYAAAAIALFALAVVDVHADEWHAGPGISFVSGTDSVVDRYKANVIAQSSTATVDKPIPVAVAFDVDYEFNSGLRMGAGLGPFLRLRGSKSHFELPINGTIGYNFQQEKTITPYVKGGVVYHYASGDFYRSSTPGVLAAGGVEFARASVFRYAIEASIDRSKVELDVLCKAGDASCHVGTEKVNSFDAVVTFFVKF